MKKGLKIFFITLASILIITMAAVSIVVWYIFTPERITPLVQNTTEKFLTCKTEIGEVDFTFFSTFPQFGIKINNLSLVNPLNNAQSDTLAMVQNFIGTVDIKALWYNNEIKLSGIKLKNGRINIFTDEQRNNNYSIIKKSSDQKSQVDPTTSFDLIQIKSVDLQNINFSFIDQSLNLEASANNLFAKLKGSVYKDSITGKANIENSDIQIAYNLIENSKNSGKPLTKNAGENTNPKKEISKLFTGKINNLSAQMSGTLFVDSVVGNIKINQSNTSLNYDGIQYLNNAMFKVDIPLLKLILPKLQLNLYRANATVNTLALNLSGLIQYNSENEEIKTDVSYEFNSWDVKDVFAHIPINYQWYINNITADGTITSSGRISGIYSNSLLPLIDVNIIMQNGRVKHKDFPLALDKINSDINIYTDFQNNEISYVRINRFNAQTPKSKISTTGNINNMFSDTFARLSTDCNFFMDEFNSLLPQELKLKMKGVVAGKINSAFSLAQVQKMKLDKLKLRGNLSFSDFEMVYDSLWVKTDLSKVEFTFPNHYSASKNTKFAFSSIICDYLEAGKTGAYSAYLKNAKISCETSDLRDTTKIPDLILTFNLDSLKANYDTISLAAAKPLGKLYLTQGLSHNQPKIDFKFKSRKLEASYGQWVTDIEKIDLETTIVNDMSQKDIFLQWTTKGYLNLEHSIINSPALNHKLFIPSIKMNFEPEIFDIIESKLVINRSDFALKGKLQNILSYFRGDSLLIGDFNFESNNTDIIELMNLTNGIGQNTEPGISESRVPYMVPKGIDIFVNTSIKQATFGKDFASNIRGNVRIKDGILVLDELKFSTPAARMQLTAIYRTPRKNHLYLGLDYHMLDIEIAQLLKMIPEIDSLMPMLRSFGGRGEFHMAIESYLDSKYNLKKSTLRGSSSIKGQDLVLMDGETFSDIAKKLRFKKKTENKVDTLSAEFTIFKDEIDVYPFLIVMDKYKAVIGGRHNFDLTYDYNISVVQSPLPFRLGVDVIGNPYKIRYKLGKAKYAEFYRPAYRREVPNKQLELRKIIRDALTQKVRE